MLVHVDPVVQALAEQHAETASLVAGLTDAESEAATPCVGWSVTDVLLHLAQSDEMAVASLTGRITAAPPDSTGGWGEEVLSTKAWPRWSTGSGGFPSRSCRIDGPRQQAAWWRF